MEMINSKTVPRNAATQLNRSGLRFTHIKTLNVSWSLYVINKVIVVSYCKLNNTQVCDEQLFGQVSAHTISCMTILSGWVSLTRHPHKYRCALYFTSHVSCKLIIVIEREDIPYLDKLAHIQVVIKLPIFLCTNVFNVRTTYIHFILYGLILIIYLVNMIRPK